MVARMISSVTAGDVASMWFETQCRDLPSGGFADGRPSFDEPIQDGVIHCHPLPIGVRRILTVP
jgi:hypothetical protein